MNIFFLDADPAAAARMHCDKHVVKMILETAQLLSTAWRVTEVVLPEGRVYGATHVNHPCSKWVRSSRHAYDWTHKLGRELLKEYTHRYEKEHASADVIHRLQPPPPSIHSLKWVDPVYCGPEQYRLDTVVKSYRAYYIGDKARFAKWTRRSAPDWWPA